MIRNLSRHQKNELIKRYGNNLINPRPCRVCQEQQINQPGMSAEIYMEPFSKPSTELTGDEAPELSETKQQCVFHYFYLTVVNLLHVALLGIHGVMLKWWPQMNNN